MLGRLELLDDLNWLHTDDARTARKSALVANLATSTGCKFGSALNPGSILAHQSLRAPVRAKKNLRTAISPADHTITIRAPVRAKKPEHSHIPS